LELSFAAFFGAGAGEAPVAAAPGSLPAAAAAATTAAWAAAGSESPGASGGGAAFAVGADGDVVFGVAAAAVLADPFCCPAAAVSALAVVGPLAAAAFAAITAVCLSPLAAIALKIAALGLIPMVPDALAAAPGSPACAVVPWLLTWPVAWPLADEFEPEGLAVAVDGAGAE
jgi:hypothetical protein